MLTIPREVSIAESAQDHGNNMLKLDSMTFVLFGATGDLAKRKIIPTLYNLFLDQKLPKPLSIMGLGMEEWSDEDFSLHVKESLKTFSRRLTDETPKLDEFLQLFHYCSFDVTNNDGYKRLLKKMQKYEEKLGILENRLFYLSVAPRFFDVITSKIKENGLDTVKGWKRLIIEKPFGHDLESARALNEKLSSAFEEDEIYRIDHYLGKSMVQNLEALKFANPVFQALWNNRYIANVQITASETVGVEERAGFYDQAGAVRDMFQNHMLQMLMMTAMQIPNRINPENIRSEKRKIMESLRPLKKDNVASHVVRGQYGAGLIEGSFVVGYKEERGIDPSSRNDTFIAARLEVLDALWSGVPFYIRTGKRMHEKSTRIVIEFKNPLKELQMKQNEEIEPNLLIIEINREGVSLQLNMKNITTHQIEPVAIELSANSDNTPDAYELLLFDVFRGDSTFFAHWKEVELSWEWVQPILDAFKEDELPLHSYPAGSMGPDAAHHLLKEDGFKWW